MATYSSWTVSGASIDYVPIENPVNETVKLFNGKEQGSVPPTTNLSSNTGQYILAQDGTWIPQPSFTSGGSDAFEILRPSVLTPTYSAYTPTVTNSANAYDVDTNHATTFGEWECAFVSRNLPITDTLLFTSFGSKTQTWTSATINISRAYGYFNDGESNSSSKVTSVKVEFSTNGGSSWTTIVTDLSTAVPLTATTSSYTFTTTPTMGNVQVKLTLVRGGGGMIYDPEIGISVPGSTGDIDLRLYDIWISGTYSGGSGNITCNNLTVTGDATFQNKIYDSTASAGTTGQVLKVAANGKVTWATDSAGTGTVTSITTTGANGVTISGGSTQTITTSGTFALALGNITPTSISTGTGSFSGDVAFASSITTPSGSSAPVVIAPDGGGDLHINTDSIRFGYANSNSTLATRGTGDLILTTNEGSTTEGIIRLYDGANGNITLTPNGTGQVQVGSDQVVTLTASQTLTNKTLSTSSTWNGNTIGVAYGGTGSTTLTSGSYVVGNGTSAVTLKTPTQVTADLDTFTYQIGATAGKKGLVPAAPAVGASVVYLDQTGSWTTPSGSGTTTNALTIQSPLTGTSFNGSTAVTIGLGTVAVGNGGTGLTTLTAGYIPYGNGTSAFGSSANLFWDSANSRLGIGTTSPSSYGDVALYRAATGLATIAISQQNASTNDGAKFSVFYQGTEIGNYGYYWDGGQFINKLGYYGVLTFNSNSSEQMRLTSTGLGIATNSPDAKLSVNGVGSFGSGTAALPSIAQFGDLDTGRWSPAANTLAWSTGGSERMRIDSSGNVGISSSSPRAKLDVSGDIYTAWADPASNFIGMVFLDGSSYRNGLLLTGNGRKTGIVSKSADSTGFIWFGTGSAEAERMRIDSSGNVGIGVTPSYALDVRKDSGTWEVIRLQNANSGSSAFIRAIGSGGGSVDFGSADTANTFVIRTNATERMRITSGGQVSINTTTVSNAKLTIDTTAQNGLDVFRSDSSANYEGIRFRSTTNATTYGSLGWDSGGLRLDGTAGTMYFSTSGTERMRITSGGELLIGNTTGTEKLTVTGNIRASGVYVGNGSSGSYTKGFGAIQTASTTPGTPSGGAAGDHFYYY